MANLEPNNFDPSASYLRRGANAIQGMENTFERERNRVPITPLGLKKFKLPKKTAQVMKKILRALKANRQYTIQRRHRTRLKQRNRRVKRRPRVRPRHLISHLFGNRNPLWIPILRREQICPCSLHQSR